MRAELAKQIQKLVEDNENWGTFGAEDLLDDADRAPDAIGELAKYTLNNGWVPIYEVSIRLDDDADPPVLEFWKAGDDIDRYALWNWRAYDDALSAPVAHVRGDVYLVSATLREFLALMAVGADIIELPRKKAAEIAALLGSPSKHTEAFRAWLASTLGIEVARDPRAMIRAMVPAFIAFDTEHRPRGHRTTGSYWYAPLAPARVKTLIAAARREQATQPTKKPTTKPTKKPATKPTKKPATKPTKKPATKPTKKPATKPIKKPATKPTKKPATKPTKKPATKPTKKPATKPTMKPATKPIKKPAK